MEEEWRDVTDYPGYQVSNLGRVRGFWKRQKRFGSWGGVDRVPSDTPYVLSPSDDGNGYLKVFMTDKDGKRHCRKIHRIVAEEFIPRVEGADTVDHIKSGPEGKLDNTVDNLRWLSRRENIQKAYSDGVCDTRIARSKSCVMIHDWCNNTDIFCDSVQDAGDKLNVHYTTISHALSDEHMLLGRYTVRYADLDEVIYYGSQAYEYEYEC